MDNKRFAVLIDVENISVKYLDIINDEMSKYGSVTYKRAYADWTSKNNAKWRDQLRDNSIVPIQQFSNTVGKNASDSALIIDAMDILYSERVDGFCIVSSDGDFTRLASRLRESGMEVIGMGEAVGQSIRKKKDSSIVASVKAVADGRCEAVVSAGSTGAAMAASLFGLGRIHGVTRPAIAVTIPTMKKPVVLIDGGANSESTPEMLAQFASMGVAYAKLNLDIENPKVGILSIGEEEGKGNTLVKDTYPILKEMQENGKFEFVGNVEGKELFVNKADVVVADGFAGNVALKVTEGTASLLLKMIEIECKSGFVGCLIGLMAKPFLRRILNRINWESFGGMLLLGVRGISVIAHGRSSAFAMKNAVRAAVNAVNHDINSEIAQNI